MNQSKKLLDGFKELYEKQDILRKLTTTGILDEYGFSEIHCIDLIGRLEYSNVTKLANALNMTRGAISKITKKLISKDAIVSYQKQDNKKEIYFQLTDYGQLLYKKHKINHELWERRDEAFFELFDENNKEVIINFLNKFNCYLEHKIQEMSEHME